jgi:L-asparaginase II
MNRVEVWRGHAIESEHRVHVAVVDGAGVLRASAGSPERIVFARSAVKPIQALPLIADGVTDRYAVTDRELALCCASHSGEAYHVAGVRGLLRKTGVDESALACGAHAPFHASSARQLQESGHPPARIHNNCSGKHAGMIALASAHGWPVAGYHELRHPVQQRMMREICAWTGTAAEHVLTAVDGCGVVTFALPLDSLARAFGALAAAARRSEPGPYRIMNAMSRHPEYVGGTGRLCTELSRAVQGRIVAKTGAEGVYCVAVPGAELGIALKVEDGATRASEPALLAVLRALTLISDEEMAALSSFAEPLITNTRGERVGRIRASITLEPRES